MIEKERLDKYVTSFDLLKKNKHFSNTINFALEIRRGSLCTPLGISCVYLKRDSTICATLLKPEAKGLRRCIPISSRV